MFVSHRSFYRKILWSAGSLAMILLTLGSCSSVQIHRAQEQRSYLGDELYVESFGSGRDTIVFIPGLMGSTAYWKTGELRGLKTQHRVLFVDPLGFGRSPWPDIEYTLEDQLDAMRRTLVSHNAVSNVTLVAHSFGAIVAIHYAALHPDEVARVILFGAPIYRNPGEARDRIQTMSPLAGLLVKNRFAARVVCAFHNAIMPLAYKLAPNMRPDLPAQVARDGVLHFWPSLDGSVRHVILGKPVAKPMAALGSRATLVFGSRDTVSDSALVESLAAQTGARFIRTTDDHGSYSRWRGQILTDGSVRVP